MPFIYLGFRARRFMIEGIKNFLSRKKLQNLACFSFRVREQQQHIFLMNLNV